MTNGDFSETGLKLSYWYLTHRAELKKWWVFLIGAIDVFLVVFVLTNVGVYLLAEKKRHQLLTGMVAASQTYSSVRHAAAPAGLTVVETVAVPTTAGKYDLVAKVSNPNRVWAVKSVKPIFRFAGKEVNGNDDFFLPNEEKYVFAFGLTAGVTTSSTVSKPELVLGEPTWVRVPDLNALPPFSFRSEGVRHDVVTGSGSSKLTFSEVAGTVENINVSNFWHVRIKIIVKSGTAIVGVNQTFLDQFEGLTKRPIDVTWVYPMPAVTEVSVVPEVNVLESDSTYTK